MRLLYKDEDHMHTAARKETAWNGVPGSTDFTPIRLP